MLHRRRMPALALVTVLAATGCQDEGPLAIRTEPEVDVLGPTPPTLNPQSMEVEGYPVPGELRSGFIQGRDGSPLAIVYEVHEGLAVWQGDIVLGDADEIARTPEELASSTTGPLRGVVIDADGGNNRWPGGVIPYTIDTSTPGPGAGVYSVQEILDAIDMIEDQTPGVTLIPRTSESDYVTFQGSTGCSSEIGRIGGQQFINLADDCSTGNTAHEILHALGMFHEHTRCDRDLYVTIDYDEIESGKEGNFYKAGSGTEGGACSGAFDIGTYDPGSMMHYGQFAFAIGSNPTIIPLPGVDASQMGQRSAVGPTDAETIDALYGTNNAAPSIVLGSLAASYDEGTPVPFDASGSTDADDDDDLLTFAWSFGDGTCPGPSACTDDDPDHAYADDGGYLWGLTVSDGFDASIAAGVLVILNVAPTVDAGAATGSVDEGSEWTRSGSFTDPGADTWEATVDYDDGSGPQALTLSGKTFLLANTWIDNGVNTVLVTVDDDDEGSGSDEVEVTVLNVAPTVNAGSDAEVESGQTFDFSGSFSDPGIVDDPWTWVIDWGFGPDTEGSTDDQSAAIEASRQVCVAGTYTVTLSVTDKDGGEGSDDLTLTVPYVAVDIDIMPGTDLNPVSLKKGGNLPVAILGSAELDVSDIDAGSLTLGDESDPDTGVGVKNNGAVEAYLEDVNGDGFPDLVAMFPLRDLVDSGDLDASSTELVLRGFMADACTNIRGADGVSPLVN